ncbi:unnamed protein product [Cylicocyclus nassatus]|uniref:Peptidase A2 domain-containing protein n=1 Tax=Cylicocyclus nassatus TaxID=53992 RepID=A0AA36GP41_CYLNA|nr:unnamed protein product [Cylicocyclus nassatus]
MLSTFGDLNNCSLAQGNCNTPTGMVIWEPMEVIPWCKYNAIGEFNALVSIKYVLVPDHELAFDLSNNHLLRLRLLQHCNIPNSYLTNSNHILSFPDIPSHMMIQDFIVETSAKQRKRRGVKYLVDNENRRSRFEIVPARTLLMTRKLFGTAEFQRLPQFETQPITDHRLLREIKLWKVTNQDFSQRSRMYALENTRISVLRTIRYAEYRYHQLAFLEDIQTRRPLNYAELALKQDLEQGITDIFDPYLSREFGVLGIDLGRDPSKLREKPIPFFREKDLDKVDIKTLGLEPITHPEPLPSKTSSSPVTRPSTFYPPVMITTKRTLPAYIPTKKPIFVIPNTSTITPRTSRTWPSAPSTTTTTETPRIVDPVHLTWPPTPSTTTTTEAPRVAAPVYLIHETKTIDAIARTPPPLSHTFPHNQATIKTFSSHPTTLTYPTNPITTSTIHPTTAKPTSAYERLYHPPSFQTPETRPDRSSRPPLAEDDQPEPRNLNPQPSMQFHYHENTLRQTFNNICIRQYLNNQRLHELSHVDPTWAARLLLRDTNVVATLSDNELLVTRCRKVEPTQTFPSHQVNNTCYDLLPVLVEDQLWFAIPATGDLVQTATTMPCPYISNVDPSLVQQILPPNVLPNINAKPFLFNPPPIYHHLIQNYAPTTRFQIDYLQQEYAALQNRLQKRGIIEDTMLKIKDAGNSLKDSLSSIYTKTTDKLTAGVESIRWSMISLLLWVTIPTLVIIILIACCVCFVKIYFIRKASSSAASAMVDLASSLSRRRLARRQHEINALMEEQNNGNQPNSLFVPRIYSIFSQVNSIKSPLPYVRITLNRFSTPALIDSGATISYMKQSTLYALGPNVNIDNNHVKAQAANGTQIELLASAIVNVQVGTHIIQHRFLVSQDCQCPAPVLLGTDFIKKLNQLGLKVTIDLHNNLLTIGSDAHDMVQINAINFLEVKPNDVRLSQTTILPKRSSSIVPAYIDPYDPSNLFDFIIEDNHRDLDLLYVVGRSLVSPNPNGACLVNILNPSNTDMKLYGRMKIAHATPVSSPLEQILTVQGEYIPPEANWEERIPHFPIPWAPTYDIASEINLTKSALTSQQKEHLLAIVSSPEDISSAETLLAVPIISELNSIVSYSVFSPSQINDFGNITNPSENIANPPEGITPSQANDPDRTITPPQGTTPSTIAIHMPEPASQRFYRRRRLSTTPKPLIKRSLCTPTPPPRNWEKPTGAIPSLIKLCLSPRPPPRDERQFYYKLKHQYRGPTQRRCFNPIMTPQCLLCHQSTHRTRD